MILNTGMTKFIRLSESIQHIEDLSADRFIDVIRNLSKFNAQEKLDGANLWLGVQDGKLFTSREGKRHGADRKFSVNDWALVSAHNQFRAAHAAVDAAADVIKSVLQDGQMVEIEVLFGDQPNSVSYGANGKSYIAILRGVLDTPDEVAEKLSSALHGKDFNVTVELVHTNDGKSIQTISEHVIFQFIAPTVVDTAKIKAEANVDKEVQEFEAFLKSASSVQGFTNYQLLSINLQKVPKDERDAVKTARSELQSEVLVKFKLPIKQMLLDKIVKKSALAATDDGVGIEGIVLRDNDTGDQIKIVDKDVFTTINKFNQHARQCIQSSLNTTDENASLDARGGIMGELRISIAGAFGDRELARGAYAKKELEKFKGETPSATILKFSEQALAGKDFYMLKRKVLALCAHTAARMNSELDKFQAGQEEYLLKLKNGKEITLSSAVKERTLLVFAEARQNLEQFFAKVKSTKTLPELAAVVFGKYAKAIHAQEELTEGKSTKKKTTHHTKHRHGETELPRSPKLNDVDPNTFKQDIFHIIHSYVATVLVAMLIYKGEDARGMRFLRDQPNMWLKKWTPEMSPVNHWGYVVWRHNSPGVKKLLSASAHRGLVQVTRHFQSSMWKFLHRDLSSAHAQPVKWKDHLKLLNRLLTVAGLQTEYLNRVTQQVIDWENLTLNEKVNAINVLYSYALRFIPNSIMFSRLRIIQQNLLLNATGENDQMIKEQKLLSIINTLSEDENTGSVDVVDSGTDKPITAAANVAALPTRLGVKRVITRRRRNPEAVQRLTLKFPDPRKEQK